MSRIRRTERKALTLPPLRIRVWPEDKTPAVPVTDAAHQAPTSEPQLPTFKGAQDSAIPLTESPSSPKAPQLIAAAPSTAAHAQAGDEACTFPHQAALTGSLNTTATGVIEPARRSNRVRLPTRRLAASATDAVAATGRATPTRTKSTKRTREEPLQHVQQSSPDSAAHSSDTLVIPRTPSPVGGASAGGSASMRQAKRARKGTPVRSDE